MNIEDKIYIEQKKLIELVSEYGCNSHKVLKQSQKLDKLIFEVTKINLKNKLSDIGTSIKR
jgi:hypothetical protein